MIEVRQSAAFVKWYSALRDPMAARKIAIRITRMEAGLLGDVKFFDGIGEVRVNYGPGYRVYFVQRGPVLIVLLCGGDKSSQARDITAALAMAKDL